MRVRSTTIVCLLAMPALARAQTPAPVSCVAATAETDGYRIGSVNGPFDAVRASGLKTDDAFTVSALTKAQDAVAATLNKTATENSAARFAFVASSVSCHSMDPVSKTVLIDIRADELIVAQGSTAGEILDEANHARISNVSDNAIMGLRTDHDASAGQILGAQIDGRFAESDGNGSIHIGGWKSLEKSFYSFTMSTNLLSPGERRHWLPGFEWSFWFEKVPFANSRLATKGLTMGFATATQRGKTDIRGHLSVAFSSNALEGHEQTTELVSQSHKELSLQWGGQQEFTFASGFFRLGAWLDTTHRFGQGLNYHRVGMLGRLYEDIDLKRLGSMVVDLSGNTGIGSTMPVYRMFTGGNRLDPLLIERVESSSDVNWRGPIVRGFGASSLMLPVLESAGATVPKMWFSGASLTIGLPGYTRRLIELADADEKPIIDRKLEEAFDVAVADMMARRLADGASVDKARKDSRTEAIQLQRSLNTLIRHARSLSVRPLLAADIGTVSSQTDELSAWSVGGGARASGMRWGAEILFFHSRAYGALGAPPVDNQVVIRLVTSTLD